MATAVHTNQQSSTGTNTLVQTAVNNEAWNLTSLVISIAGPVTDGNGKLTIYDGGVTDTVLFATFLDSPTGSVGTTINVTLPRDAQDRPTLQGSPGSAMTIVVDGVGANQSSINARFTTGLPG